MGALVSSRFHYMQQHPNAQLSYSEMEHELTHLKKREQLSSIVTLGSLVLAMLTLGGILGGSAFILGALFAIAAFSAAYAYCCRQAESGLRDRQMTWYIGSKPQEIGMQKEREAENTSLLDFFSSK